MIEVPKTITHAESLSILIGDFPLLSLGETRLADTNGDSCWKNRDVTGAYYYKVVAARNYDALGDGALSAGFSYDRAGKNAILLGFIQATFLCRVKATRRYLEYLNDMKLKIPIEALTNEDLRNQYLSRMSLSEKTAFNGLIYNGLSILELDERNSANEFENGILKKNRSFGMPKWLQQEKGVLSIQALDSGVIH